MRFKRTSLTLLVLLGVALWAPAALRQEDIKVHKLDNGMRVLLLEDHDIPNVALYTFFHVGSRNERTGITGVSHFIEHMMFNGTEKIGPGEFDRKMEFLGGSNNAYTGEDMTAYTDWFPAPALETMIQMESDRIQGLLLDPKVLESERGVIASERRMSVENNNESILEEHVRATSIMAHPYHWGVIGWMSDILNWKREDIQAYYKTFYAPSNATLILVGDFKEAEAMALVSKYYGPIPAGPKPPAVSTVEPPQMGIRRVLVRKEAQAPCFLMYFHAPKAADANAPALQLLETILMAGESSRLYRRLVDREQLATDVGGGFSENIDPGLFSIQVKPRPGADLAKIEKVVMEELAAVGASGVTDRELQKAKNMFRMGFFSRLQSISMKADTLGRNEILYGGFEATFQRPEIIAKVGADQIKAAAKQYFQENNLTVGTLVPEGEATR